MTLTSALVYFIIACYFVIERALRKGEKALSLQTGEFDRGSSRLIWGSGLVNLILLMIAPILNVYQLGGWNIGYIAWVGVSIMLFGLGFRYWAAQTLGEFYTRTLQIVGGQSIINRPPYRLIRHPGYLGVLLMELGAGLALANWVVLFIVVFTGVISRYYRIQVEEDMLQAKLGEKYQVYSEKTWRLIPFLY